jgi:hypothetical protein
MYVDILIHLLKNLSALGAPPADDVPEGVEENSVLHSHNIAPVKFKDDRSKYTTFDMLRFAMSLFFAILGSDAALGVLPGQRVFLPFPFCGAPPCNANAFAFLLGLKSSHWDEAHENGKEMQSARHSSKHALVGWQVVELLLEGEAGR